VTFLQPDAGTLSQTRRKAVHPVGGTMMISTCLLLNEFSSFRKAQLISPPVAIVLTGGRDSRFLRRQLKARIAFASFGSDADHGLTRRQSNRPLNMVACKADFANA
jgi:hypothetical protein